MSFSRIHAAVLTAVTACLLATPAAALAATSTTSSDYGEDTKLNLPSTNADGATAATGGGGGNMVRTFVGLAVVVAVIYGLYWILRQVKSSREERVVGGGLETTATVPLGPNRSLHLVRAGNEQPERQPVQTLERGVEERAALAPVGDVRCAEQHDRAFLRQPEPRARLLARHAPEAFEIDAVGDANDREAREQRALRREPLDPARRCDDRQLRAFVDRVLPAPQCGGRVARERRVLAQVWARAAAVTPALAVV